MGFNLAFKGLIPILLVREATLYHK